MTSGVTCPKCGLMQLSTSHCKSCGTPLGGSARKPAAPHPTPTPQQPPAPPPHEPDARSAPGPMPQETTTGYRLTFHGSGGSLFGIQTVNTLLTLVTLGIYSFWGRVRVRQYLMSQTECAGDRFAYHGTGKELFVGWLKAFVVFILPAGLLGSVVVPLLEPWPPVQMALAACISLVFMSVIPFAMVGARRYRLSRTSCREIRFSFRGRVWDFLKLFWVGSLLSGITFGLYYPFFDVHRYAFMTRNSYFGSERFDFDGQARDLFWAYLAAVLLTPFTLGVSWLWLMAKRQRYLWNRTLFGRVRFRCTITGGRYLLMLLGNALIVIFTLGIGWPWAKVRSTRFVLDNLSLEGVLDLEAIRQEAQAAAATGEALAGFLDTGFDLG